MRLFLLPAVFFLVLILPLFAIPQAQRAKLEKDKRKIEQEIEYTNKLLEETRATRTTSLNEIVILDNKISRRLELITTISDEITLLNYQITNIYDSVALLEEDLVNLREEYARMIYYAYKNMGLYDRLMFIFASEDFNQAYQRLKYLQLYNEYRRTQAELIRQKQEQLVAKSMELEQGRREKEGLLLRQEEERGKLQAEKSEKNRAVSNLGKKEKELLRTLKEKERAAEKLQKTIEDIIAEEIRLAGERAREESTVTVSSAFKSLSAADVQLSDNFTGNKGKLPWPLDKGMISSTYGEHPHPVLSNVKTKNNGIDILTDRDAEAKAVFDGVVTRVINVPNNNNVVIIRHGEYLTVYSNLDQVYIQKGEQVKRGQPIGKVYFNPDASKTELHFEIWQAKTLMNPQEWLRK